MPEHVFKLDNSKRFTDQEKLGHNRWHPEIPPVATVKPGDSFRVDCREWFDGAIKNDDSAQDILDAPLLTVHTLSGPFAVEGAKPGDLLIVESQHDTIVPHQVVVNYREACLHARSLTYRLIEGADHGLTTEAWQTGYTQVLVNWFTEIVFGKRSSDEVAPVSRRSPSDP